MKKKTLRAQKNFFYLIDVYLQQFATIIKKFLCPGPHPLLIYVLYIFNRRTKIEFSNKVTVIDTYKFMNEEFLLL